MIPHQQMRQGLLVVIVMLALMPQPAVAVSCTFSIANINFGNEDMTRDWVVVQSGLLSAACIDGNPNGAVTLCLSLPVGSGGMSGNSARTMKSGATAMKYNHILAGQTWGQAGGPFGPHRWQVTLRNDGAFNGSRTHHGRIFNTQTTLPAGVYTDNFIGSSAAKLDYKQGSHDCPTTSGEPDGTSFASFTTTATNIAACSVTATNLQFGQTDVLDANVDAQSTIRVTCTNGVPYDIGLDKGTGGGTASMRRMTNGNKFVSYQMSQDASHTLNWGDKVGSDTARVTGSGSSQAFTVYGRVPPQTTPAPGTYTDTIIVTVTF